MATPVPQRQLRNETAALLRRVQQGEELTVTVHGHPVAALVPLREQAPARFVPRERLEELRGLLAADDPLEEQIRAGDEVAEDPLG